MRWIDTRVLNCRKTGKKTLRGTCPFGCEYWNDCRSESSQNKRC